MSAGYLKLFREGELDKRVNILAGMMEQCTLCPRDCGIDRTKGEKGFCRISDEIIISHALPHYGEEPPVSGKYGAGTIFFSCCNLRCIYCQNYQISHECLGKNIDVYELSQIMADLQKRKCHNIEAVTPTPHLFQFIKALSLACGKGLNIPVVYNSGGYENPQVIKILDGIINIYLPDFKYGNDEDSYMFSGVRNYVTYAVSTIKEMVRQVGDLLETESGIAKNGIIIRHLVLPGKTKNSLQVLQLIKEHVSTHVPISIMAQYTPTPYVRDHPLLGRRITLHEYETVVNHALDMGFEHIFIQEINDKSKLTPNFEREIPFEWNKIR